MISLFSRFFFARLCLKIKRGARRREREEGKERDGDGGREVEWEQEVEEVRERKGERGNEDEG